MGIRAMEDNISTQREQEQNRVNEIVLIEFEKGIEISQSVKIELRVWIEQGDFGESEDECVESRESEKVKRAG